MLLKCWEYKLETYKKECGIKLKREEVFFFYFFFFMERKKHRKPLRMKRKTILDMVQNVL